MPGKYIPAKGWMAALVLVLTAVEIVQADVSMETLKSIAIPDKIQTSIGTLEFSTASRLMPPSTSSTTTWTACEGSRSI